MKKIGEAAILIVADVIPYVSIPIRSLFFFCSRSNEYKEQSSLRKNYCWNSVFCSHALFDHFPLLSAAGIFYSHDGMKDYRWKSFV